MTPNDYWSSHVVPPQDEITALRERVALLEVLLRQILKQLPKAHYWLDAYIERSAREALVSKQ